ncbi:HPr family phosphocarrier protein [bacterium]|nr:HPr family phosphocarrier protein [bacterium]MBU1650662.1 HPr family phosphocarrier protein [bacterium]
MSPERFRRELVVLNELGIHARPASKIVKYAARSTARFWIEKDGQRVNGKSIMGVMMLAAEQGSTVILEAEGEGADELLDIIEDLIRNKFNET